MKKKYTNTKIVKNDDGSYSLIKYQTDKKPQLSKTIQKMQKISIDNAQNFKR